MPRRKTGLRHLRAGRPGYDHIQLFLEVEAGRRRLAMSVNEFCHVRSILILRGGRPVAGSTVGMMHWITGKTLRRRYQEARESLCPPASASRTGRAARRPVPRHLQELIDRHYAAGGGLFPHN